MTFTKAIASVNVRVKHLTEIVGLYYLLLNFFIPLHLHLNHPLCLICYGRIMGDNCDGYADQRYAVSD
ncbi:hypothetical protein [Nostoc sp. FACHB-133]|uniref:hypothetical protein n=1 Tax=Nostoc sp. FACHB-133 TaxID=2692835 RepID=UPI0016836D16|nr:hypothetical protein [Nostoc sp. FACHB-133]MBD2527651.1 hypothetical protein [Nostoc sp. FACHB-133]